jgi:hypothetical protein
MEIDANNMGLHLAEEEEAYKEAASLRRNFPTHIGTILRQMEKDGIMSSKERILYEALKRK